MRRALLFIRIGVAVCVAVASCSCATLRRWRLPPISEAVCYRAVDSEFVIDGRLDEKSWASAPKLALTRCAYPLERLALYPGRCRVQWSWDDQNWYVAFTFWSPDINCPKGKKDWRSWTDDQVEMLIDPNGDQKDYAGLEIMARKYWLDYVVDFAEGGKPNKLDKSWGFEGIQIGISVDGTIGDRAQGRDDTDKRWICEMAIPWAAFKSVPGGGKPEAGASWRVNLLANDFLPPKGKAYIEFMWSRTYDLKRPEYVYHVPERFGRVIFSGLALPEPAPAEFLRTRNRFYRIR